MGRYEKRSIIQTTLECPVCKKRTNHSRCSCFVGKYIGPSGETITYLSEGWYGEKDDSYYECKQCGHKIGKSRGKYHGLTEEVIGEEIIDNGEAWYLDCERD